MGMREVRTTRGSENGLGSEDLDRQGLDVWINLDNADHQVANARVGVTLKRGTGPRRANKIAAAETAGKGYRPDLRQVSVVSDLP